MHKLRSEQRRFDQHTVDDGLIFDEIQPFETSIRTMERKAQLDASRRHSGGSPVAETRLPAPRWPDTQVNIFAAADQTVDQYQRLDLPSDRRDRFMRNMLRAIKQTDMGGEPLATVEVNSPGVHGLPRAR